MHIVVAKHRSHREAAQAEIRFYRSLTGQQRLDLLLELIAQAVEHDEAAKGFKRVYRIVKLDRR